MVRHSCDNPPCCNPAHLLVGTAAQNAQDMAERGRHRNQQKDSCPAGHPYDEANTWHDPAGKRRCRACRNAKLRAARAAS